MRVRTVRLKTDEPFSDEALADALCVLDYVSGSMDAFCFSCADWPIVRFEYLDDPSVRRRLA